MGHKTHYTKVKKHPGEKKRKATEPEDSRNLRIFNSNMADQCRLPEDEQYKFMFNPRSLKDLQRPKKRSGDIVCLRFHTIGHCFKDCEF